MNPLVFREYDIRGHAERDLTTAFTARLGQVLGAFYRERGCRRICVGRDCRLSSDRLHGALVEGLTWSGIDIIDVGVVPTPLLYFSVFHCETDGGVQITGSHNPPDENGFKLMIGKDSLYGDDIQRLRERMERVSEQSPTRSERHGRIENLDIMPAYVATVAAKLAIANPGELRVAIDAGNGAGGPAAVALMRALGVKPVELLCTMDGRFPTHHPDPSQPENLELLRTTVLRQKLSCGIAYDGDADRIGVIDEQGSIIWGDKLLILFARSLLKEKPGASIIGEVKCSQTLYDDIAKHGGRPIIWKTGHSLIKKKIKESGAMLAGEVSGHMFFADRYYGFDDAIYASARLLELLSTAGKPLSALLADVPETVSTPEIRVACSDEQKFAVVDRVRTHFEGRRPVLAVDGARIQFDHGWGLVRASNTQPVLVMRFEAETEAQLRAIRAEVEQAVQNASSQGA